MIKRIDVTFIHADHDETVFKYINRKLGRLGRFIPKAAEESAHLEVLLKYGKTGKGSKSTGRDCTCEVTLHLPKEIIVVSETSINMYTAIDIAELKLRQRIKKYKELHSGSFRRRLVARFSR